MLDLEFEVEMYTTAAGRCPVQEFLDELTRKDPRLHVALAASLLRLRNGALHRRPLTAPLRDGILEVRAHGNAQGRILFSFEGNRLILLLAGLTKRTGPVPNREIETALARQVDWRARQQ